MQREGAGGAVVELALAVELTYQCSRGRTRLRTSAVERRACSSLAAAQGRCDAWKGESSPPVATA